MEYKITNEITLLFTQEGYRITIGDETYTEELEDFDNDVAYMIEVALEDIVFFGAEYYDNDEHHENVLLPAIHKLEKELIK